MDLNILATNMNTCLGVSLSTLGSIIIKPADSVDKIQQSHFVNSYFFRVKLNNFIDCIGTSFVHFLTCVFFFP